MTNPEPSLSRDQQLAECHPPVPQSASDGKKIGSEGPSSLGGANVLAFAPKGDNQRW